MSNCLGAELLDHLYFFNCIFNYAMLGGCRYAGECRARGGQKRASDPLTYSYSSCEQLTWVLGSELGSPTRTVHRPHPWAISLALVFAA